jgi:adenylate cyclase
MTLGRQSSVVSLLIAGLLGTLLSVFPPQILEQGNREALDQLLSLIPAQSASGQVAIVEIDDATLAQIGRWPWPRKRTAELIDRIHTAGAKAIVLNLFFPEAEDPLSDQILSSSLARSQGITGFQFEFNSPSDSALGCPPVVLPIVLSEASSARENSIFNAGKALCNVSVLQSAAKGFLNIGPREKGLPMAITYQGLLYPSLALAAATSFLNERSTELQILNSSSAQLKIGNRTIPLDAQARMTFGPAHQLPTFSAKELFEPNNRPTGLAGKLVVVGVNATGIAETGMPILQATAIDNLIRGHAIAGPGTSRATEVALLIASLAASAFFMHAISGWYRWLFWAGLPISLIAGSWWILKYQHAFISPLPALICLSVHAISLTSFQARQHRTIAQSSEAQIASARQFLFSALSMLTTIRHAETGAHQQRIQLYLHSLAIALSKKKSFADELTPENITLMVQIAPIHDIGKVGIPDQLLLKAGPLTATEFQLIQQHVTLGKEILDRARDQSELNDELLFRLASALVYSHHERWDGSGYPLGLAGSDIPLVARLMAVADVYDALVSKRVYKESLSHEAAKSMILAERGRMFDPDVVDGFLEVEPEWRRIRAEFQEGKAIGHHGLG